MKEIKSIIRIFKDEKGNIVDTLDSHHFYKLSRDIEKPDKFIIEWKNELSGESIEFPIYVYYNINNYRVYNVLTGFWIAENSWKKESITKLLTYSTNKKENNLLIENILSNKDLTEREKEIKKMSINKQYEINKEEIEEIKEEKKYYEGKRKKATTTSMKVVRNSQLAKDYKEYSKEQHNGKCVCEICELEHDERMVDVHHKIQVSDYEKERKEYSTFEDVILLCPLCHRATHIYDGIEGAKEYFRKTIDKR